MHGTGSLTLFEQATWNFEWLDLVIRLQKKNN